MNHYQTSSAILFLVFNRPDTTAEVFEEIRKARPARLYIAADGPRAGHISDQKYCLEVLNLIQVDWNCEVKTLYRKDNLGCKNAVASAIDWFFEQEEDGIILEDDCLPGSDFFRYCDEMLERYRLDTRVRHIAGANLQLGKKYGNSSYYFANQTHVWGWASWRRVWKDYDRTLNKFDNQEAFVQIDKLFDDSFLAQEWKRIFNTVKAGGIDTWDYQLAIINYFNNSLSINPNVNLIKNIGFRQDATHTTGTSSPYANIPLEQMGEILHPQYILPEKQADYAIFDRDFNLQERWKKHNLLRRRMKRWLKSKFQSS